MPLESTILTTFVLDLASVPQNIQFPHPIPYFLFVRTNIITVGTAALKTMTLIWKSSKFYILTVRLVIVPFGDLFILIYREYSALQQCSVYFDIE
jgi:hypothetical protein